MAFDVLTYALCKKGGTSSEELNTLKQTIAELEECVADLESTVVEKSEKIDKVVEQVTQTSQNTLREVQVIKQQVEQNNVLIQEFDRRLADYDTTTVKFVEA